MGTGWVGQHCIGYFFRSAPAAAALVVAVGAAGLLAGRRRAAVAFSLVAALVAAVAFVAAPQARVSTSRTDPLNRVTGRAPVRWFPLP